MNKRTFKQVQKLVSYIVEHEIEITEGDKSLLDRLSSDESLDLFELTSKEYNAFNSWMDFFEDVTGGNVGTIVSV